jgi:hypothetical protein
MIPWTQKNLAGCKPAAPIAFLFLLMNRREAKIADLVWGGPATNGDAIYRSFRDRVNFFTAHDRERHNSPLTGLSVGARTTAPCIG